MAIPLRFHPHLPGDLPVELVDACIVLPPLRGGLLGDALLVRAMGRWCALTRASLLEEFVRLPLTKDGVHFRSDDRHLVLTATNGSTIAVEVADDDGPRCAELFPSMPTAPATGSPAAPPPSVEWFPQIADLVSRGRMIDAIKLYREATGVGLKEAKEAVERGAPPPARPQPAAAPSGPWLDEVRALVAKDQLIQAIKRYREATGVGLKEAKDAVEALGRG